MARVLLPAVKQPQAANDIVGFNLQNATDASIPAQYITFQQTFLPGAVSPNDGLTANDGPVQMDVKTTHGDGSVRGALITFKHPSLSANSMTQFMLAKGAPPAGNPPTFAGFNLRVVAGATDVTFDASKLAMSSSYWQRGPLATQVRANFQGTGSFRITVDAIVYEDGTRAADVQFNNDAAMQASGGTQTYTATISWDGTQVLSQAVTHYQYQTWHKVIGGSPANVVVDVPYLIKTGAIPNLNLAVGVDSASNFLKAPTGTGILGSGSVTKAMPGGGTRPDLGLQPGWNAAWLLTQHPAAAKFALNNADAAGSVPWHYYDPTKGTYVRLTDYPTLWTDPRGTPTLRQPVRESSWTYDRAHMPDLCHVPYLLTGRRYYLDQVNAQATFAELWTWNAYRQDGKGLVANGEDEVRAQAWSLRMLNEAAWSNPTASSDQVYWKKLADDNWAWLVGKIPAWTTSQGQTHGRVPGTYGDNTVFAPWQQDYFSYVTVQAVLMGSASALTFLKWQMNFLVGRFLNGANGFNPRDGISYNLPVRITWSGMGAGNPNGSGPGWPSGMGNFGVLALASLAGIIRATGDANAQKAYDWLKAANVPESTPYVLEPQFDVVPATAVAPPPPPPPPPDPAILTLSAALDAKLEGASGPTLFTFAVKRTGNATIAASANWSVAGSGSNPANASDFVGGTFPSGTVSFAANDTADRTISISVNGDSTVEPDENFIVTLSNPSANTTIAGATGTGTIVNDDTAPPPPPAKRTVVVTGDAAAVSITDTNVVVKVDGVTVWP